MYDDLFTEVHRKMDDIQEKLRLEMIEDFSVILKETGEVLQFFSGMGVYGFEINGENVYVGDSDKYLNDEDRSICVYNDLFKRYDSVSDRLETDFGYFVDFCVKEGDYA